MNKILKNHLFILVSYVSAAVISTLLGASILGTLCNAICNAIFGAGNAGNSGTVLLQFLITVLTSVLAIIFIHMRRVRNREEYRAFAAKIKEREAPYSPREDYKELKHNRDLWEEVIFVAIVTTLYWLFNFFNFWLLLNIPLFILFNFISYIHMHQAWAEMEL